jgi:hypothetical protein
MTGDNPASNTSKSDDPKLSVPDSSDDVSIIYPPNALAQKAKKTEGTLEDLLANSERMMAGMKGDFEALVDRAIQQLPVLRDEKWRSPATRSQAVQSFCGIANVLKGKSGSFGYGIMGEIADLFRDYLRETPPDQQQADAVSNYINTLQIVWRQRVAGDGGDVGRQIVADLTKLNERAKLK